MAVRVAFRSALGFRSPLFQGNEGATIACRDYATTRQVPQAPKRPLNPFFKMYLEMNKTNPKKLTVVQLVKEASERYKKLGYYEKERQMNLFRKDMEKYKTEKQNFLDNLTERQRDAMVEEMREKRYNRERIRHKRQKNQMLESLAKPKKGAISGFSAYLASGKVDFGNSAPMAMKGAKIVWDRMAEQDKKRYNDIAEQNRMKYEASLKVWEKRMIAEGRPELVRVAFRPKEPKQTTKQATVKRTARREE